MTNTKILENKISAVKKYLKIAARYQKYSNEAISNNLDLRGAVERYLYLAVQATIDLAEVIIALKKLRKPTTMSENFEILAEEEIVSQSLKVKLVKMVGLEIF